LRAAAQHDKDYRYWNCTLPTVLLIYGAGARRRLLHCRY